MGKMYPFSFQPQFELAYSTEQPAVLQDSQEFLGQPGQDVVLELRIRVIFNHKQIAGVVHLDVEERWKIIYLRIHHEPDSRTRSDRTAIRRDSSVLSDSEELVVWYFNMHYEPFILDCCATKAVQSSRSGNQ